MTAQSVFSGSVGGQITFVNRSVKGVDLKHSILNFDFIYLFLLIHGLKYF